MASQNDRPLGTVITGRRSRMLLSARRSRLAMTLAAGLAGGTMLSTCQTQVRDAFVSSSKDLFLSLFSPDVVLAALGVTEDESTNTE